MKLLHVFTFAFSILLLPVVLFSQNTPSSFSLSGQIRYRAELDGRSFVQNARPLGYQLLRSRVNLSITPLEETKIYLQLQDSRLFGAGNAALNRGTQDGMSKAIDFHQAYFSVQNVFNSSVDLKVGRQEMSYGRQRLISPSQWNNIGNTFDAVVAHWNSSSATIDAFRAKLVTNTAYDSAQNFLGVYGTVRYSAPHFADLFFLNDNNNYPLPKGADKGTARLNRYTFGTSFAGKPTPFDYEAEVVLQRGRTAVTDSTLGDIDAYLLAFHAGYTINTENKLRLAMKYQLMSGDDNQKSGSFSTYNTLFTSAHSFFGYMDYFPKTFTEYGIRSISLHASMELDPSTAVAADLYHYRLDKEASLRNPSGQFVRSSDVGNEMDLTVIHKYSTAVTVNTGVSAFVPNTAMRLLKSSSVSYWTYLMTTINF